MTIQTDMAGEATVLPTSDVEDGLRADIAGMEREIQALRLQVQEARRAHEEDIRIIGEALLEEAERQDWCARFDDAVSDINTRLAIPLPEREREYEVTVTGYVKTAFTHTLTITLRGSEDVDEAAREAAREAMGDVSAFDLDLDTYSSEIEEWEVDGVELA